MGYTLTPENSETVVTWEIDDETVATIDNEGILTGKSEGLAVAIATTANGLKSNFCFITVILEGDVNDDGTVDVADIATVIDVMSGTSTSDKADVNGDGTVDVADIATVIDIMATR